MVCATVEMLSLTYALLPVFAIQVKETLRQVSASPADCPPIGCFKRLTFRWLEGLSASETEASDHGYLPMSIGTTTQESDLKSNPCCGWLITVGWGGEDIAP